MPTKDYDPDLAAANDPQGKRKIQKLLLRKYPIVEINGGYGYDVTAFNENKTEHLQFDVQCKKKKDFDALWAKVWSSVTIFNRMFVGWAREGGYPEAYFLCTNNENDLRFVCIFKDSLEKIDRIGRRERRDVQYNCVEDRIHTPIEYWHFVNLGKQSS